jgi:hypothetical protein
MKRGYNFTILYISLVMHPPHNFVRSSRLLKVRCAPATNALSVGDVIKNIY